MHRRRINGREGANSGPTLGCPISGEYSAAVANAGGRAPIEFAKDGVESAHTAKASSVGDLGQWFSRLVKEALRPLYTPGLRDLLGAGPDVPLEQTRKVARAYPEPIGQ